jgi:hypothetical protein
VYLSEVKLTQHHMEGRIQSALVMDLTAHYKISSRITST